MLSQNFIAMKVLVIYFSQSGQMLAIAKQVLSDISQHCSITYAPIVPVKPFPFPWTATTFFDAMPECVLQIPSAIEPMPELEQHEFDFVILAYQPWFLHPSNPVTSFLKSEWAKVLKNKPIITLIGCRNMWLNAQEKVKEHIAQLGGRLVGNIVLEDKHGNMTSTLTIVRWLFKGQKEASKYLPAAGVSDTDLQAANRFGKIIWQHGAANNWDSLHENLLQHGAVNLHPQLIVLEKRGVNQFPKWAKKAVAKGQPGNSERLKVIKTFQRLLFVAIFILSPITNLIAKLQTLFQLKQLKKAVTYFSGISLLPKQL